MNTATKFTKVFSKNLAVSLFRDKDVPSCQISMDEPLKSQVDKTTGYLPTVAEQKSWQFTACNLHGIIALNSANRKPVECTESCMTLIPCSQVCEVGPQVFIHQLTNHHQLEICESVKYHYITQI